MKARLLAVGLWSSSIVDYLFFYKTISILTGGRKFPDEIPVIRNLQSVIFKIETNTCRSLEDMGYDVCVSPNHRCRVTVIFRPVETLAEDLAAAQEEPVILNNMTDEEEMAFWDEEERLWNEKRKTLPWYLR